MGFDKKITSVVNAAFDIYGNVPRYSDITMEIDDIHNDVRIRINGPKPHSYCFGTSLGKPDECYTAKEFYSDLFRDVAFNLERISDSYVKNGFTASDLTVSSNDIIIKPPVGSTGCYSDYTVKPKLTPGDGPDSFSQICENLADIVQGAYLHTIRNARWPKTRCLKPADAIEAVYTSGPVTTLIFKTGEKVQVRTSENDLFNAEKGLAMCVCKAILDKDTYELLCKYAGKGAVITLAKFLMSPPEYEKLKADIWKRF